MNTADVKRIAWKLALFLAGMSVFLLATLWIKGMEIRLRVFMAIFAGLSAWMGLITMVIWLWKEGNKEENRNVESDD